VADRTERPLSPGGGRWLAVGAEHGQDRAVVSSLRLFVVVSGPPASGKSTLAPGLAGELGLPLVAKDTIKNALMSVLPVPDLDTSRQLGRAAVAAMFAVAAQSPCGAVIESVFHRSAAIADLRHLPGRVIEVFCRVDRDVARQRYLARADSRHAGHFDRIRTTEELWNDEVSEPVAAGWPLVNVDTTKPVDVAALARFAREMCD
jgi:predicted kinase